MTVMFIIFFFYFWYLIDPKYVTELLKTVFFFTRLVAFCMAVVIPFFIFFITSVAVQTFSKYLARTNEGELPDLRIFALSIKLQCLFWKQVHSINKSYAWLSGGKDMIKVTKPGSKKPYVPKCDRDAPVDEQTVFYMQKLHSDEQAAILDDMVQFKGTTVDKLHNNTTELRLTRAQLVGWRNVCDVDDAGNLIPIPFDPKRPTAMYDLLPAEIQDELEAHFGTGKFVEPKEDTAE